MLFREAVLAFLGHQGAAAEGGKKGQKDQAIGAYCHGADLEECRAYFGAALEQQCRNCPE